MKIITTVGTSLIGNSPVVCNDLENESFSASKFEPENDFFKKHIKPKEDALFKSISDSTASAELASLKKIDPDGQAEIYLLCTETVTSYMCGRVLQRHLGERAKVQYVEGLQVKILDDFKKRGVPNILTAIERIAGHYWENIVLNVTGGYKAIIPIMAIIGQIKKLPTYYLFKGEDDKKYELIEMPKMPIDYQSDVFDTFWETFSKFEANGNGIIEKSELEYVFMNTCEGFLEIFDNLVTLNPIGKILWWSYQQQFFVFKCPEPIWIEMNRQQRLFEFFKQSFSNAQLRNHQTITEDTHKFVMKKHHDTLRIYWFNDGNDIYVYKTFEDHSAHENYIRSVNFDSQMLKQIQYSSKIYRIKLN